MIECMYVCLLCAQRGHTIATYMGGTSWDIGGAGREEGRQRPRCDLQLAPVWDCSGYQKESPQWERKQKSVTVCPTLNSEDS